MNVFAKLGHISERASRGLHVRSGINPMLWLSGIALPICLFSAYTFDQHPLIQGILVCAAILPIVTACLGFGYFAVRHPDKLQSEDYQIRHEAIQMLQIKVDAVQMSSASLDAIAMGVRQQLETGSAEKQS
jgi:hypothetical protein